MKTWQMVKELTEKPNLKFINQEGYTASADGNRFVFGHTSRPTLGASGNILLQIDEWELIQEPVPFTEAFKAWDNGKLIRCELHGETVRYKHSSDDATTPFEAKYIALGKWYIET